MKVNLDKTIKTMDGKNFQEPDATGKLVDKVLTLREVIFTTLTTPLADDQKLPAADKMRIYRLAQRVSGEGGIVAFTVEDLGTIKDRLNKLYGVHIFGIVSDLLEGEETPPLESVAV